MTETKKNVAQQEERKNEKQKQSSDKDDSAVCGIAKHTFWCCSRLFAVATHSIEGGKFHCFPFFLFCFLFAR
jgi:hypothetical protein